MTVASTRSAVRRLEDLLDRMQSRSLADEELLELGRAYRRSAALLARARTAGLHGQDTEQLNRLLARAYPLLYAAPPRKLGSVRAFLLDEFPRAFREEWRFVMASTAVLLIGAVVGAVAIAIRPENADFVLGVGWRDALESIAQRHEGNKDWLPEIMRPQASVQIMTNNIKVAFNAFALGILLCIGTLYFMAYNGVMLGAVAVVVHQHGTDLGFWSFVAPHGVLEIPAILIAGAAGMIIGYALIAPGRLYRKDALKLAARRAVRLILGVVILLIVAGIIEGFLSPNPDIPPASKMAFASLAFTTLCVWLTFGGRVQDGPPPH